jgi:hypothetical protein
MQTVIKKHRAETRGQLWFVGKNCAAWGLANPVVVGRCGKKYSYSYGSMPRGEFHADTRAELKLGLEDFFNRGLNEN